ncbi:aminotransferase-like domain-containing protein [Aminipila sp.]|uniref:aminotransferase-like domain-containing protein n=1 Tax=Aminipila sp. TaxID=2060095 RepID=UPI00289C8A2E|nr:PLP-dependent aminotransferase family protein [Aminipila sp.]
MPFNSFENYPMSWKPVIDKEKRALYRTLASQLEEDIVKGKLLPGTKLPPQRELADFLDINVSTVSKAFKVCELKGLLSAIVGSGTYVSFDALSNVRLLAENTPTQIIQMGTTVPDYDANEFIMQMLKKMVNEQGKENLFSYASPNDTLWQKDAAVLWMKKCGFDTKNKNILFANGGQNAIAAILVGLFKYGDKIGVAPHTYSDMKAAANMFGIQLVPIDFIGKKDELNSEALIYSCKKNNLKGIYIIPDHQNPTTHTMSIKTRKELGHIACEQGLVIIEDGTYHLMSTPKAAIAAFAPENTIYIASLSKAIAPGLRLAYVAAPDQYRTQISNALYNMNITVSPLMAGLAARLIISGQVEKVLEIHRKKNVLRNEKVNKYLSEYDCRGENTGIFRWLLLPEQMSGADFEALAFKHGVQVYAAERFAVGNTVPERAVRVAVCGTGSIEELEQGLRIIKELLAPL